MRQSLNVQYAMARARQEGIPWLLNIDSDELFLPEVPARGAGERATPATSATEASELEGSVRTLFAQLGASGVEAFAFMNHEVVPEHVAPVDVRRAASSGVRGDPFTSLSLFKRSAAVVPKTAAADRWCSSWSAKARATTSHEHGVRALPTPMGCTCRRRCTSSCRAHRRWIERISAAAAPTTTQQGVPVDGSAALDVLHYAIWDPHALWASTT